MWTRRELKQRAKNVLKTNYWKAFLIALVVFLSMGGSGGSSGRGGGGSDIFQNGYGDPQFGFTFDENFIIKIMMAVLAFLGIFILFLALRIFLGYPLEVGGKRYFVQSASYNDNRGCFRFAFKSYNYKNLVLTMLLKDIFNFLWFLLFIIPGIVKYYAYSMVPYILSDNPNIGATEAINLSKKLTYGHKFDMFVLDLSFIGWYLLGLLAVFIGTLFVHPYYYATQAELYLTLRQNGLNSGMCTMDDLALAYKFQPDSETPDF